MAEEKNQQNVEEDEELSELLDSALKDFDVMKREIKEEKEDKPTEKFGELHKSTEEWNAEYIKEAALQFDESIKKFLEGTGDGDDSGISEEQIKQGFEQMAAAAQAFLTPDGSEPSADFATTINQAIHDLSQGPDMTAIGEMAEGDPNAFLPPFMQGMMQSLLSKEVLYPSLKDVLDRFPEWLSKNKEKLTSEDNVRYQNQQKLMKEVCSLLEKEQESDTKEVKNQRFGEVLNLMQKLQDYGQPPADLVGDMGPPPDMKNCSIM
ncbi:hypothetical protein WA026_011136 [Henosepilachna vigintioctopunctata]|uniref:Peroxin-19 n=1 Tax=Henosepilachna vigintioctopunctata TaxID=420089 RepID=A0AAW1U791_9CUCU